MSNSKILTSTKKPSIVVRQTVTSKLRAERGDKLQFIKNEIKKIEEKQSLLNSTSKENVSLFKKPFALSDTLKKSHKNATTPMNINMTKKVGTTTNISLIKNKSHDKLTTKNINKTPLQPDKSKNKSSSQVRINLTNKFNNNVPSIAPKQDIKSKRQSLMPVNSKMKNTKEIVRKPALKTTNSASNSVKKTVTVQSPVRKSLTAMHFKRVNNTNRNNTIHRTVSWSDNLSPKKCNNKKVINQTPPSFKHDNSFQRTLSWSDGLKSDGEKLVYRSPNKTETISFHTPSVSQRRSIICNTPMSIGKQSMSPYSIISTPTTSNLKRRLHLWLEKRGKPLDSFHHLRCFGIQQHIEIDEENKENFETFIPDKNSSYEDLNINNIETEKPEDPAKDILIANDAMYDLHKLILEGYPREQCEAWLDIICSKFQEVQDRPQYWECKAALEEVRGNYQRALDCYSNAIAKGAEVEKVNEPLDNLLEKFSVLNISQTQSSNHCEQPRSKASLDARNVFKSSIINFAIQDMKDVGEDGCKFTATPVRRSTRMSRSHYVSTPNTKICSTLEQLDSSIKNSLHFKTNKGFKH